MSLIESDVVDKRKYIALVKEVAYDVSTRHLYQNIPSGLVNFAELREYLNHTISQTNNYYGENTNNKIDDILQYELVERSIYDSKSLPKYGKWSISLWKGDITSLVASAIVNAANSKGLGCFIPGHKCIDNVIHSRAGPRMRDECRAIMETRDSIETGDLIVTRGYNLPARNVLHVVGPIYDKNSKSNAMFLSKSYLKCLQVAKDMMLNTLAIPCVSTGEFRYPKREGALIALETVKRFLSMGNNLHVIFVVYTDEDHKIYKDLIPKVYK